MTDFPKLNGVLFNVKPLAWTDMYLNYAGKMSLRSFCFGFSYRIEPVGDIWVATFGGYPLNAGGYVSQDAAKEACYTDQALKGGA